MSPREAIKRLESLRKRLENPRDFYATYGEAWKQLARETALTILLSSRPPDMEAAHWSELSQNLSESIGAQLLTGNPAGILIFAGRKQGDFEGSLSSLTFADVVAYVRAGRDGNPYGKTDFTDEDEEKSDEQVAANLWESLQEGNPDRRAAIEEHLTYSLGGAARALYPDILSTWKEVFSERVKTDFRSWARDTFK